MNNKIINGMRKEGKPFRNIMLFGYIFAILMPLSIYLINNDKYSGKDIILFAIAGIMFGTIGFHACRILCMANNKSIGAIIWLIAVQGFYQMKISTYSSIFRN